jgi:hypothetical protein
MQSKSDKDDKPRLQLILRDSWCSCGVLYSSMKHIRPYSVQICNQHNVAHVILHWLHSCFHPYALCLMLLIRPLSMHLPQIMATDLPDRHH